jgi:homocitrate synthase NifV
MNKITNDKAITFRDANEAARVLELVRYANVATQKPMIKDELLFIARYPEIAQDFN